MKLNDILSAKLAIGAALLIGAAVGSSVTSLKAHKAKPEVIEVHDAVPTKEGLAYNIGGKDYTEAEVFGNDLEVNEAMSQLYSMRVRKIKDKVQHDTIEAEAKKAGKSVDDFLRDSVYKNEAKITQKDIEDFFAEKQIPKNNLGDQALLGRVTAFMTDERHARSREAFVSNLIKATPITVYYKKPGAMKVEEGNSPTKGKKDAKISIVVFSDFQCPFCQNAAPELMKAAKDLGESNVKVTFKHFPLPMHQQAFGAAEYSACVYATAGVDSFWKFHDDIFNSHRLAKIDMDDQAKKLGVKVAEVQKCIDSGKGRQMVQEDMKYGDSLHVRGTPTIFINGVKMNNAVTAANLKSEIESLGN